MGSDFVAVGRFYWDFRQTTDETQEQQLTDETLETVAGGIWGDGGCTSPIIKLPIGTGPTFPEPSTDPIILDGGYL